MIIKLNDAKDLELIEEFLEKNNIDYNFYANEYKAVCAEEIRQSIDCSDSFHESQTFYDTHDDKTAETLIKDMTNDLYESRETNGAFQILAETAMSIVNCKLEENNKEEI